MLTALLTVENLFGETYDTWRVNVEAEYHEEQVGKVPPGDDSEGSGSDALAASGSGRSAPLLPARP